MGTLTVGDVEFRVVGQPDWSMSNSERVPVRGGRPGDYALRTVACFIAATVELTRDAPVSALDKAGVVVTLKLDDGRVFFGEDMWATGNLVVRGDRVRVRYEGQDVWELV